MAERKQLYKGKSKTVYDTGEADVLLVEFRNDATAFNGARHALLEEKGQVNCAFDAFVMAVLAKNGIKTHWLKRLSPTEILVRRLDMLKIECVMRNRAAGSICKRLGLERGRVFSPPLFEFFLKDDALGDPLMTEDHVMLLELATPKEIASMKALTYKVNEILKPVFAAAGFDLVDFKLEFGYSQGELLLGDEFTLDGCRLWDQKTGEIYDKDRFRQDLGDVIGFYKQAAERLGVAI
ncbi:MAG: phosphoribosylaminoimidazolesuccinocarboxamide synthase [Gammaproteobacteria bacterium]|nr:phosphoribosylaminoimidazolesuccinocarboxamide synthase [Gammaproteobacteria bacterium]